MKRENVQNDPYYVAMSLSDDECRTNCMISGVIRALQTLDSQVVNGEELSRKLGLSLPTSSQGTLCI